MAKQTKGEIASDDPGAPVIHRPQTLAEFKALRSEIKSGRGLVLVAPGSDLDDEIRKANVSQMSLSSLAGMLAFAWPDHLWLYRARECADTAGKAARELSVAIAAEDRVADKIAILQASLDRSSRFDFRGHGDVIVAEDLNAVREQLFLIGMRRDDINHCRRYLDSLARAADKLIKDAEICDATPSRPFPIHDPIRRVIWFGKLMIILTPSESFLCTECWRVAKDAGQLSAARTPGDVTPEEWSDTAIIGVIKRLNKKFVEAALPLSFSQSPPYALEWL